MYLEAFASELFILVSGGKSKSTITLVKILLK